MKAGTDSDCLDTNPPTSLFCGFISRFGASVCGMRYISVSYPLGKQTRVFWLYQGMGIAGWLPATGVCQILALMQGTTSTEYFFRARLHAKRYAIAITFASAKVALMKKILFTFLLLCSAHCLLSQQQTGQDANRHMHKSTFEELVKQFERPDRDFWQKPSEVLSLIRPLRGKRVLDLGCGTGYFTFKMADSGANVIAADIDGRFLGYVDSVREARGVSKKAVQTRKVEPNDPGLEKREVDFVFVANTFHHITDRVNYFRKVKNGLRSQGFVVVIDYFKKDIPVGPPVDMKLSADDVIRDLKLAGFSLFRTDDKLLPYQYIVFAM